MERLALIAIGGNSLISDESHVTVKDQLSACENTAKYIAKLIQSGWRVVITHGNGPQVGYILRRAEIASTELHTVPLDSCVADTEGAIGYQLQISILNELNKLGIKRNVVSVVTEVEVDDRDPSFENPTKPIGSFMAKEVAEEHRDKDGWHIIEDAGRGYRRVVPSPKPIDVVEKETIKRLLEEDVVVIAAGGGGIPVVRDKSGALHGKEAVIDKDLASALLAKYLNVDVFMISTAVDKVCIDYKKPNEKKLDSMNLKEAEKYIAEKQFALGSMLPKINAVVDFVRTTGKIGVISTPENIKEAILGEAGTRITL